LVKVKGVVDGFRNPRPEFFHIKMAQTPVALGAKAEVSGGSVVLAATNRYSFTDLNVLRLKWRLSQSTGKLDEGTVRVSLPPRSSGPLRLSLPAKSLAKADMLLLNIEHPGGWNVATYQFPLKPVTQGPPQVHAAQGLMFPRFNFVTGKVEKDDIGWRHLERVTGELAHVTVQKRGEAAKPMEAAALAETPMAEVQSIEAELMVPPATNSSGHLHVELAKGKMRYTLAWIGGKADAYELGWIFRAPKTARQFSWDRQGVWSYYPPDHIGRSAGTATPDSAGAQLTKVDRANAFDFNSTKFNCNWASLTDDSGHGLCLVFPPTTRHQVRGGIDPDGICTLIANRCYSPPRDISTPIVKDFYTELTKGTQVSGRLEISGED